MLAHFFSFLRPAPTPAQPEEPLRAAQLDALSCAQSNYPDAGPFRIRRGWVAHTDEELIGYIYTSNKEGTRFVVAELPLMTLPEMRKADEAFMNQHGFEKAPDSLLELLADPQAVGITPTLVLDYLLERDGFTATLKAHDCALNCADVYLTPADAAECQQLLDYLQMPDRLFPQTLRLHTGLGGDGPLEALTLLEINATARTIHMEERESEDLTPALKAFLATHGLGSLEAPLLVRALARQLVRKTR